MFPNLESHVFNSYLLQSSNTFCGCDDRNISCQSWLALYNWTRNTYTVFTKAPELMMIQLHEDFEFLNTYFAEKNGRPKLKSEIRKALTAMNSFLRVVWDASIAGACNENSLILPDGYEISKKYVKLLGYTGIEVRDNSLYTNNYVGMFSALKQLTQQTDGFAPPWKFRNETFSPELSVYANGFRRFVRCVYDKNAISAVDVFGRLSGNIDAYNKLIQWLKSNGYKYGVCFDISEVKDLEASGISFKKNIKGANITDDYFMVYDHEHIGIRAEYSTLHNPPQSFHLTIQNPRDILSNFKILPQIIQKFIVSYHAKCNNCGYCTQRNKGKSKPFTIQAIFKGKTYSFCPINHVYTYCWQTLSDELVDGFIAYLGYIQDKI